MGKENEKRCILIREEARSWRVSEGWVTHAHTCARLLQSILLWQLPCPLDIHARTCSSTPRNLQAATAGFASWQRFFVALRTSPYLQMFSLLPLSLFSSPQDCFFLSLRYSFPFLLKVMDRAQKLYEGEMHSSRKAGPTVDGTKYREDTNSFSWRAPVLSFSNLAAILLPEWCHFKHVLMQGIVQS